MMKNKPLGFRITVLISCIIILVGLCLIGDTLHTGSMMASASRMNGNLVVALLQCFGGLVYVVYVVIEVFATIIEVGLRWLIYFSWVTAVNYEKEKRSRSKTEEDIIDVEAEEVVEEGEDE